MYSVIEPITRFFRHEMIFQAAFSSEFSQRSVSMKAFEGGLLEVGSAEGATVWCRASPL